METLHTGYHISNRVLNTCFASLILSMDQMEEICQVCGSFQYPYCPNYSTAPYRQTPVLLILGALYS